MRFDPVPVLAGAVAGPACLQWGGPLASWAARASWNLSVPFALALLGASCLVMVSHRLRRTDPPHVSLPHVPPPATPDEWLRMHGILPTMSLEDKVARIRRGLQNQVLRGDWGPRLDALLDCVIADMEMPAKGVDHVHALAGIMDRPDPDGRIREYLKGNGIARSGAVMNMRATLKRRHLNDAGMLLGAIARARRMGATGTGDMAWVARLSPALWHAVNGLGRPACSVVGIGILAHYEAEVSCGARLAVPDVEAGIAPLLDRFGAPPAEGPR